MDFEGLWHRHEFEVSSGREEGPNCCVYARKFSTWAEGLCVGATTNPTIIFINQAKVLLLDKYMEWRSFVPKRHRTYTGSAHICVYHVFETAYDRLRVLELSLTPPMLFLPEPVPPPSPPAPPPPPPQIAGVFIGEFEDE